MDNQPVDATLYSLSDAPPPPEPADRRDGERHMTLFRVGSITVNGRRELCLIKNISAGGMMIRPYCSIQVGDPLSIELKSGHPVGGKATWVRDSGVGIAFDRPIDVVEILSHSMEGPRPRMPRIEIDAIATVRDGANVYRMKVCDVSQGGLKLAAGIVLPFGADVVVSLAGMGPQPGSIRWCEDGYMGITFNRLVPLAELVGWLQAQREELRAAS